MTGRFPWRDDGRAERLGAVVQSPSSVALCPLRQQPPPPVSSRPRSRPLDPPHHALEHPGPLVDPGCPLTVVLWVCLRLRVFCSCCTASPSTEAARQLHTPSASEAGLEDAFHERSCLCRAGVSSSPVSCVSVSQVWSPKHRRRPGGSPSSLRLWPFSFLSSKGSGA